MSRIFSSSSRITYPYSCLFFSRIPKVSDAFYSSKVDETVGKEIHNEKMKSEAKKVKVKVISREEKRQEAVVTSILTKEYEKLVQPMKLGSINATYLFTEQLASNKKGGSVKTEKTVEEIRAKAVSAVEQVNKPAKVVIKEGKRPTGTGGSGPSRPVREEPGKVYFCCLPQEWILFFVPKTGVSGIFTFFFTFGTFLVSKEYYVLEHNFYNGLSMAIMCWMAIVYTGKPLSAYLDKEIDDIEKGWNADREMRKKNLTTQIHHEQYLHWSSEGQLDVVKIKENNVGLQLEAEYRKRLLNVYAKVKKMLDYHVEVVQVNKRYFHRNLIEWVIQEVEKNLTPELKLKYFEMSFTKVNELISKISEKEA